jgi:hypothetical protein
MTHAAPNSYFDDLRDALLAIGPLHSHVVVVGGVVPLFYRHHPDFVTPRLPPDRTRDIDIAVPRDLPGRLRHGPRAARRHRAAERTLTGNGSPCRPPPPPNPYPR